MASNDREFINHIGRYIPRINFIINNPFDSESSHDAALTLLRVLRDDLLEGFGRMEQSSFMWDEEFNVDNVRIRRF